jgi:L-fuconolactonase
MIDEISSSANVSCKLSGLLNCASPGAGITQIAPYANHVLDAFGAERVMWASDWPPLDLASDYATWATLCDELLASRPASAHEAVFSATAARVYRLAQSIEDPP